VAKVQLWKGCRWGTRASNSPEACHRPRRQHEIIDEFVFDSALYHALRETEKQIAVELGQMGQQGMPHPPPIVVALAILLLPEQFHEMNVRRRDNLSGAVHIKTVGAITMRVNLTGGGLRNSRDLVLSASAVSRRLDKPSIAG